MNGDLKCWWVRRPGVGIASEVYHLDCFKELDRKGAFIPSTILPGYATHDPFTHAPFVCTHCHKEI